MNNNNSLQRSVCARGGASAGYHAAARRTLPAVLLCALSLLSARAAQPSREAPARADENLLAFIAGEHVTRSEVVARLGEPRATFENGHVMAYRLGRNSAGYYVVPAPRKPAALDWQGVNYDLMLRFDDQGILQEHSLVDIRSVSPHG